MPLKVPGLEARNTFELASGDLAAGAAVTNGNAVTQVVPIAGSAKVKVRIKTSGNGSVDLTLGSVDSTGTFTAYGTGSPAQVAVTGGTEAAISSDLYGENWAKVTFTPSADGTITYVHVSQV